VRARPGLRVPGSVDGAELAVRAVLGQQISVPAARTAAGRLVAEHGERSRARAAP
jgi:AraC family transcriptional regulator of adaptative response / DNA-3-methyladenine glycosylase II